MKTTRRSVILVFAAISLLFSTIAGKAQNGTEQIVRIKAEIKMLQDSLSDAEIYFPELVYKYQQKIDSLNVQITCRTPAEPEVKKPAKITTPSSMAKTQATTIGKTTNYGKRARINTINVDNYFKQMQYSQAVTYIQLQQLANDSLGIMQMKPNGILSYSAVGQASNYMRYGKAPKAYVEIVPVDDRKKAIPGVSSITTDLEVDQEKEMFLPTGNYNIYYVINGKTVLAENIKVIAGNLSHTWGNKQYAWKAWYEVRNF